MTVPFILLLLPGENLSITQNKTINSSLSNESLLLSNVILRLRFDLGLASTCFMLRINSGLMGNLAQVQVYLILTQVRKWSEKKGPSRSGKSQGILIPCGIRGN